MILKGTIFSDILEMETSITVVGPSHTPKEGTYKVAYVLHGLCGNNSTWSDYSMLPYYAMEGSTLYILPEVSRSFYTDMKFGLSYFSYLTEELPTLCKSLFHISAERENTAVIGGSMGGYGALKCACSKPLQYGMCGAFASACLFLEEGLSDLRAKGEKEKMIQSFGEKLLMDFSSAFGPELMPSPSDDLLTLAEKSAPSSLPNLYLTCGTEDPFYQNHLRFCKELQAKAINYTFEEWQDNHDFSFFDRSLKKTIDFFNL